MAYRSAGSSRPAATAALAVLTLAASAGLFRVFSGHRWVGPVLTTVLVVHLACWALRHRGYGSAGSALAVAAATVLMAVWTVLGRYTWYGLPTVSTWDRAVSALGDLGNQFASMVAPVAPTTAFELLALGGAAMAAALGDWATFRRGAPAVGLLPALAAFISCCVAGQGRGRGPVIGAVVAGACLFLLVERSSGDEDLVWFADVRRGLRPWIVGVGGVTAVSAVAAAMALSPALSRRDGAAVLGWRSGVGDRGSERIVPNPLVDLRTRLTTYQNVPVFTVSSSQPSYWRLTSLDSFDGVTWTSTGSYGGFGSRLPGSAPPGVPVHTVRASFRIQQLDSVWLPAQFDPLSVQGVRGITYDQGSNSLLTSRATANGLQYSVTSYQYLSSLDSAELEAAAPLPSGGTTSADLRLPSAVPARVTQLARELTTGLPDEFAKALAIQDYLRGPQFTYSLDPPSDGSGTDAIYNFLFETHLGYCQQFAGAYAVLARAAGLPTRLAVGFTQGRITSTGAFQVLDADYHTWPEVYFGSRYGWVPFEPTKGFSVPGTGGYNHTSGTATGPANPTPATVPTTVPGPSSTPTTAAGQRRRVPPTTAPTTVAVHPTGGISPWWLSGPALVLVWLAATGGGRTMLWRRRRRRAERSGPEAVVLHRWQAIETELRWQGLERRPDETDDEFARRGSLWLRRLAIEGPWAHGGLERLAAMTSRARFGAGSPEGMGDDAVATAAEIESRLATRTGRLQRAARLFAPPPGAWRRLRRRAA